MPVLSVVDSLDVPLELVVSVDVDASLLPDPVILEVPLAPEFSVVVSSAPIAELFSFLLFRVTSSSVVDPPEESEAASVPVSWRARISAARRSTSAATAGSVLTLISSEVDCANAMPAIENKEINTT